MKAQEKRFEAIRWKGWAALALLLVPLGALAYRYAEPKLTLFAPERVRENFRDMARAFPTAPLAAAATPLELPLALRPLAVTYEHGGRRHTLDAFLERSQTTSLTVVHHGTVVHEWFAPGYGADDRITSFSVMKSFVATLVGVARDRGLIRSLDDPIADYVPQLRDGGFARASIRDVLTMSSGVAFSERYDDPSTDAFRVFDEMFVFGRSIDALTASYPHESPPGRAFHYASINTHALAMLVSAVNERPLQQVLESELWGPLGAQSAYLLTDLHGTPIAFWGLNARPRDFARLGLLYLQGGEIGGTRVVSRAWIDEATHPGRSDIARGSVDGDFGYGLHWWLPRDGDLPFERQDYAAIGIWGQLIYVNADANLVVVKTGADAKFKRHEYEAIQAFRAVARELEAGS